MDTGSHRQANVSYTEEPRLPPRLRSTAVERPDEHHALVNHFREKAPNPKPNARERLQYMQAWGAVGTI